MRADMDMNGSAPTLYRQAWGASKRTIKKGVSSLRIAVLIFILIDHIVADVIYIFNDIVIEFLMLALLVYALTAPLKIGLIRISSQYLAGEKPTVKTLFAPYRSPNAAMCLGLMRNGIRYCLLYFSVMIHNYAYANQDFALYVVAEIIRIAAYSYFIFYTFAFFPVDYIISKNESIKLSSALKYAWSKMKGRRIEVLKLKLSLVWFSIATEMIGPLVLSRFFVGFEYILSHTLIAVLLYILFAPLVYVCNTSMSILVTNTSGRSYTNQIEDGS